MKSIFSSKTVLFNIIMTLVGIAALLQATFGTALPAGIVSEHGALVIVFVSTLLQGIGNLILRIFFTAVPLTQFAAGNHSA